MIGRSLQPPRQRFVIRRDDKDFNIACQPDDLVIFRNADSDALRRACFSLRWEVVSEATRKPSASPLARLNRAGHLLDGATFVRARPKRQYPAADGIKPSIACIEGIHCPNIGGANLGFALDTLSSGTISRGVAPCPFRRVLGPRPRRRTSAAYISQTSSTQSNIFASSGCALANCSPSSSNSPSARFMA